jgi:hypothetical protein
MGHVIGDLPLGPDYSVVPPLISIYIGKTSYGYLLLIKTFILE